MVEVAKEKTIVARGTRGLIEEFAERYAIDKSQVKAILKGTIMKKDKDGMEATDEELIAFLIVANQYHLNPFTKEIYAYPDKKRGGIVPVVGVDGWNKLMTTHPDYKTHSYKESEKMVTNPGAKECPSWIEVHIEKTNGGVMVVREYLDECYRALDYSNPWKTHTKRMLRHKAKIQGAREAFGFGGIYDEDEAERIREAKVLEEPKELEAPQQKQLESPKPVEQMPKAEIDHAAQAKMAKLEEEMLMDGIEPTPEPEQSVTFRGLVSKMTSSIGKDKKPEYKVVMEDGNTIITPDIVKAKFCKENMVGKARVMIIASRKVGGPFVLVQATHDAVAV